MFFLLLAIICSSSIALIFKYTENSNCNRLVITSANYFMAFGVSLIMILGRGLLKGISLDGAFLQDFYRIIKNENVQLSPSSSIFLGMGLGLIAGVFFFYSFIFYQKSVKVNGASLSGAFGKIGILIPMLLSVFIWKEYPTYMQWIGISLAILAIVLVNLVKVTKISSSEKSSLLCLLFLFGGLAEFSNKIYQYYAINKYKDIFLFVVFFIAFIISISYCIFQRVVVCKKDIITGFAVGIPNLFSSYFLILALDSVKASVVFPLYSAGSIVLINVGSFILFHERVNVRNKVAIFLTVIALLFINY